MSFYPFTPKATNDPRINNASNRLAGTGIDAEALELIGFTGRNGAGAITLTGAAVGDVVIGVANVTDGADDSSGFETAITVVNQIQQSSASDLSTKKYAALLLARS